MDYSQLVKLMKEQKVEMTQQERLKAYFSGEEVDFLPYNLLAIDQAIAVDKGYTIRQLSSDVEIMSEVIQYKKEVLGLEGVSVGMDLRTLGAALGSELKYQKFEIEHVEKHVLEDYKDFDKLEIVNPHNNLVLSPMLENAKKLKDRFPDMPISTGVCGPFSAAAAIRPVEKLLRDSRKNPNDLNRLLVLSNESSLEWVKAFCHEFGPVGVFISDPVTCSDILSLEQFKKLSLPHFEYLVNKLVEITGIQPMVHICGHTKSLWPDLKNLNISTFSVDNCEDIGEAKEELGDKLTIWGNVSPVDAMRNGTIDDVIEACRTCIGKAADSPKGYQLDTGCQVPLGTPKENVDAFIYAVRKYGKGARKGEMPKGMLEK